MKTKNSLICPKCGTEINVNEILYHQLHEEIEREFEGKIAEREKEYKTKLTEVGNQRKQLEEEREKINELVEKQATERLKNERHKIESKLRTKIAEETSEQIKTLQDELNQKSNQIKELNKAKADIERLKREKEELKGTISLEKEKELNKKLTEEKQKIKKQADEENYLKIKEKEKVIADLKGKLEDAQRKAEQGSGQLKGEVQELELEKILRDLYPTDEINEIKKGQKGADVLQTIKTNFGQICGKIYYESKRTKDYQNSWLKKFREDNLNVKADICVLVTEALPNDIDKFGLKEGIWVCSFNVLREMSLVLRDSLIKINSMALTQKDKGSKMEMLYDYLTSQEFKLQFGTIIEGFKALQDSYHNEKLKMQKIWKEREKQFDKILTNTVNFYGSIKGIAGGAIPQIKALEDQPELPEK